MQERHDRPTEYAEVSLGPVLAEFVDAIEEHVEQAAEDDIRRALNMRSHPGDAEVTRLNDRLHMYCQTLAVGVQSIPEQRRTVRGVAALETWASLTEDGPAPGPLGAWSHSHHLAQTARDMLAEIRAYRAQRREAAFVGRPGLPPLAPASERRPR
ncbi:DUF6415 family natural product biosynthesis protein [Streptomyces purpureus]|uniref:Uncharacterized protein n=1 Tax=Streptomyces purpureus TaxID=1951 RepID=A0A918LXV3_9ACTN|nr:DUF6415 family natural product biosynthesis protein [Streptomyces purpureus]GGT65342.1 hypothetical protein GCM10014713_67850 [Streptomyces purpureus]